MGFRSLSSDDQRPIAANVRVIGDRYMPLRRFVGSERVFFLPIACGDRSLRADPPPNIVWTITDAEAEALVVLDEALLLDEWYLLLFAHEYGTGGIGLPTYSLSSTADLLVDILTMKIKEG